MKNIVEIAAQVNAQISDSDSWNEALDTLESSGLLKGLSPYSCLLEPNEYEGVILEPATLIPAKDGKGAFGRMTVEVNGQKYYCFAGRNQWAPEGTPCTVKVSPNGEYNGKPQNQMSLISFGAKTEQSAKIAGKGKIRIN